MNFYLKKKINIIKILTIYNLYNLNYLLHN